MICRFDLLDFLSRRAAMQDALFDSSGLSTDYCFGRLQAFDQMIGRSAPVNHQITACENFYREEARKSSDPSVRGIFRAVGGSYNRGRSERYRGTIHQLTEFLTA